MIASFSHSFQAEVLKSKRTVAIWLVIAGAFFTPGVIIIARLIHYKNLPALYASPDFWMSLWRSSWESMALFLLPMGIILIVSLITQLEFRNNTWKQLHTLPLTFTTIFFSKLTFVIALLTFYFVLFNIGIYMAALVPYLIVANVPYPPGEFPFNYFLEQDFYYLVDCLPVVALQYLLSLRFKNFLVPMGVGFLLWIGSLGSLSWAYGYFLPYTYDMYTYLKSAERSKAIIPVVNFHAIALVYFIVLTVINYFLYSGKDDKG